MRGVAWFWSLVRHAWGWSARAGGGGPRAGQAAVELVAVVPLIALAAIAVVQVGMAAHAWSAAREAARAGARAEAVDAPARQAARRVLGEGLARDSAVARRDDPDGTSHVVVRVRVPMLLPWTSGPVVSAEAEVHQGAVGVVAR